MRKVIVSLIICILIFVALIEGCTTNKYSMSSEVEKKDLLTTNYLDDLLFERYETLSIIEYRERIKNIIDGKDGEKGKYKDLFTAMENNVEPSRLYDIGTNKYYIYNVIIPIVSIDWLNKSIGSVTTSGQYKIEYSVEYNIINPKKITVGERNGAITNIHSSFEKLVKEFAENNSDLDDMTIDFKKQVDKLVSELSNENFKISIEGVCRIEDDNHEEDETNENKERTKEINLWKKEYEQVLSLNTDDISEKTVDDFLKIYIDKVQSEEFQNIQNKLFRNIVENNLPEHLTDKELFFLTITLEATSKEFIALYQEKSKKTTIEYRIDNMESSKDYEFFTNYNILYTISDCTKIKIKDRDYRIKAIKDSIEKYVDNKTKDELEGGLEKFKSFLKELTIKYSTDNIKFEISVNSYNVK